MKHTTFTYEDVLYKRYKGRTSPFFIKSWGDKLNTLTSPDKYSHEFLEIQYQNHLRISKLKRIINGNH